MSTAHVANAGIVSGAIKLAQRLPLATVQENVEPVSGAFAAPARDQTPRFYDDGREFDTHRHLIAAQIDSLRIAVPAVCPSPLKLGQNLLEFWSGYWRVGDGAEAIFG